MRHRSGVASGGGKGVVSAGALISEIDEAVAQIDAVYLQLTGLIEQIRSMHGWLMMVLTGGRPDILQRVNAAMAGSRVAIEEACTLLRLAKDDLREYVRGI